MAEANLKSVAQSERAFSELVELQVGGPADEQKVREDVRPEAPDRVSADDPSLLVNPDQSVLARGLPEGGLGVGRSNDDLDLSADRSGGRNAADVSVVPDESGLKALFTGADGSPAGRSAGRGQTQESLSQEPNLRGEDSRPTALSNNSAILRDPSDVAQESDETGPDTTEITSTVSSDDSGSDSDDNGGSDNENDDQEIVDDSGGNDDTGGDTDDETDDDVVVDPVVAQNPGNDKPVGNSPFDGQTGASGNDLGNGSGTQVSGNGPDEGLQPGGGSGRPQQSESGAGGAAEEEQESASDEPAEPTESSEPGVVASGNQNPGNDKEVGNSPFDGQTGASGNDLGNGSGTQVSGNGPDEGLQPGGGSGRPQQSESGTGGAAEEEQESTTSESSEPEVAMTVNDYRFTNGDFNSAKNTGKSMEISDIQSGDSLDLSGIFSKGFSADDLSEHLWIERTSDGYNLWVDIDGSTDLMKQGNKFVETNTSPWVKLATLEADGDAFDFQVDPDTALIRIVSDGSGSETFESDVPPQA